MSVPDGTRLGPYDIIAPLGAGGMGEVYRAIDRRLKRQVAIKILPFAFAADQERLARFQREAEVLASLNHPNIAAVYGLEDAVPSTGSGQAASTSAGQAHSTSSGQAVTALVMELVEGLTLADRIKGGPIPIDEALPIARQIAAGLEAAHEQGIVHRDLKPANIKVRDDGSVKILDFGLAKLADTGLSGMSSQTELSNSPTLTAAAMTGRGVILGTAAYMSPEQARGRPVDKRTDVWAFGAVLYEMLTGARAFEGEDVTETMASVVKSTPNWAALPADMPPSVVTLIQRCLEKDRSARIGDIAVARFLLSEQAPVGPTPTVLAQSTAAAASPWRLRLSWPLRTAAAGTFGAVVAGAVVAWLSQGRPPDAVGVTRLQMSVVPADQLVGSRISGSIRPVHTAIAISPDGRSVVFAALRGAVNQLYLRPIDRAEAMPLAGTEGGSAPFFSPDGAWIAFWTGNTIKKVPTAGGPAVAIVDAPPGLVWGAGWGNDDTIFFSNDTGISKVAASGGTAASVTKSDGERHLLPQPLPGGRALLFTKITEEDRNARRWEKSNVVLHALDGSAERVLVPGGADARYVATGHIVFMKAGTLMAVPFDLESLQVTGAPTALVEGVMQSVNTPNTDDETGAGQFAIASSGTLLYAVGGISPSLQNSPEWVDRNGAATPLTFAPAGTYLGPRVSPDGQRIAFAVKPPSGNSDLWVYDAVRGAPTRMTFDGGNAPMWSPDGKRLLYSYGRLHVTSADGTSKPEPLDTGDGSFPTSWPSGANAVVYLRKTQSGSNGMWVFPMGGAAKPQLFLESRFDLWHPDLSPDGRWMTYVSFESGTPEVYVAGYPGPGEKRRISTAGGFDPLWTAAGRELLYRAATPDKQQFFSVTIRSLSPFQFDAPRLLFEAKAGEYDTTAPERSWHISPDAKRFLLLRSVPTKDKPVTSMHVVLNWTEELSRLVRTK